MSATAHYFDAEKATKLLRERKFDEVQKMCADVVESSTQFEIPEVDKKTAMHIAGTVYHLQGNLPKSIECFKKILSIDPKHTDAAISLSIIYNDIGKYDEAKKIYQVANQSLQYKRPGSDRLLDRKFALKHVETGDLYFKFHRYDDAIDDYARAIRLDPNNLEIRIKLAKCYAKKGFTTRAIQELQQLIHEHENYLPARIHLGLMYYSQGNVIDAQVEWERALNLDPANEEVQTYLGMARQATETSV